MDIALMLHRYRQDATEVYARANEMIVFSEYEEFAVTATCFFRTIPSPVIPW